MVKIKKTKNVVNSTSQIFLFTFQLDDCSTLVDRFTNNILIFQIINLCIYFKTFFCK
jgi:hypothetical protein